jgi:uncharacterized protein
VAAPITIDAINAISAAEIAAILAGPVDAALPWIEAAAQHGVAEAQAVLGQMLLDGNGLARNERMALHWFLCAADAGHAMAQNMVGRIHEHGWGVPADAGTAAVWYRRAADQQLDWGMYNLATLLALGRGVAVDRAAALAWLQKAAAQGHAKSLNLLGGFYEDGWEAARDLDVASDLYRRAATGGDFRGCFNHARLLGAAGDPIAALPWLARAAQAATPSFRARMETFLRRSPIAAFRSFELPPPEEARAT